MRLLRWCFKGIVLLIVLAFAVLIFFGESAWFRRVTGEKFFEELELRVEARVLPDGSMSVKETRLLRFNGEFSRYRRQLPHKGFSDMRIVRVAEPAQDYQRLQAAVGRPAGKYSFARGREAGGEVYNIELYFQAKDEVRTFVIEYLVLDAVRLHTDVAELYWQFIGRNRSVDTEFMAVSLQLPPGAQAEEVRLWGHGPLRGEVRKISGEKLWWETPFLPRDRYLEGRVVFPPRLTPQAKVLTGRAALGSILAEEQRWADQRAAEQKQALYVLAASVVCTLLGWLAAWFIYRRYGRKFKSLLEVEYYRELPGAYSPAEAGYLHEVGTLKPQAISATFMDLARRGYVRMEPSTTPQTTDILVRQLKPFGEELRVHERLLLDFFFNQVGQLQPAVWFGALKQFRKADPQATKNFVDQFRTVVELAVEAKGYFEKKRRAAKIAGWCAVIAAGLAMLFYGGQEFAPMLASALVAAAFTAVALKSRHFTQKGQQQYDLWQAFRRFLTDFSNLDRAQLPQLILWEHYLVYAVALGVAAEVIRQLPFVYPELNDPGSNFGYYWGGMSHTRYDGAGVSQSSFAGLAGFSEVMGSLNDSWSSAVTAAVASGGSGGSSSGGGDGGGFSGGGGDGGGGGGGDAD